MAKLKFTIDQINVGDEVHYIDTFLHERHFQWTVIAKIDEMLVIELYKDGKQEKRVIEMKEVLETIPAKK